MGFNEPEFEAVGEFFLENALTSKGLFFTESVTKQREKQESH